MVCTKTVPILENPRIFLGFYQYTCTGRISVLSADFLSVHCTVLVHTISTKTWRHGQLSGKGTIPIIRYKKVAQTRFVPREERDFIRFISLKWEGTGEDHLINK